MDLPPSSGAARAPSAEGPQPSDERLSENKSEAVLASSEDVLPINQLSVEASMTSLPQAGEPCDAALEASAKGNDATKEEQPTITVYVQQKVSMLLKGR